ncbi:hypothetical protein HMSSN036_58290 [Paenibacillus macerans]|nr:hypothetical protein HMSSN036_58290 [Paenibacillus macerans]
MNMTWRWYGEGNDNITLDHIRQIPGVMGIVWSLHDKVAGEVWEMERIQEVADQITSKGFSTAVVESVNVHDDIKIGLPTRDKYIDIYIDTIRKLAKVGVKVICYNFMPVLTGRVRNCTRSSPMAQTRFFMKRLPLRIIRGRWWTGF